MITNMLVNIRFIGDQPDRLLKYMLVTGLPGPGS